MHIHVQGSPGEAKYWIEPRIELAQNHGMSQRQITAAIKLIKEHEHEIRQAWKTHFVR